MFIALGDVAFGCPCNCLGSLRSRGFLVCLLVASGLVSAGESLHEQHLPNSHSFCNLSEPFEGMTQPPSSTEGSGVYTKLLVVRFRKQLNNIENV